jgi:hypothetical protein
VHDVVNIKQRFSILWLWSLPSLQTIILWPLNYITWKVITSINYAIIMQLTFRVIQFTDYDKSYIVCTKSWEHGLLAIAVTKWLDTYLELYMSYCYRQSSSLVFLHWLLKFLSDFHYPDPKNTQSKFIYKTLPLIDQFSLHDNRV